MRLPFLRKEKFTDVIFRCKKCTGKKTLPTKKKISFEIKKGMVDGHKIRLQGEGDEQVRLFKKYDKYFF